MQIIDKFRKKVRDDFFLSKESFYPKPVSECELVMLQLYEMHLQQKHERKIMQICQCVSALVVRFITRRYIGEYDPTLEKLYTFNTLIDSEMACLEILDTAGQPHVSLFIFLPCFRFTLEMRCSALFARSFEKKREEANH
jgi:Ras family